MAARLIRWALGALAVGAFALYLAIAALLYVAQEALIFPAPSDPGRAALAQTAAELGARPFVVRTRDGADGYAWLYPVPPDVPPRGAVLLLHGNGASVRSGRRLAVGLGAHGVALVVAGYRGYPGHAGEPTQAGLVADARAAFDHLTGPLGVAPERVIVHGHSLGGGVASQLLTEVTPGGLVLESTFTSLADVAARQYPLLPVRALLRHPFPSTAALEAAPPMPTLVVHGAADSLIPVTHGRTLATMLPHATYVEVPDVDHDAWLTTYDLQVQDAYLALIEQVLGAREIR